MKERPIIFSAPMVNAILEGRKTMTRRAVKPPHWAMPSDIYLFNGLPLVEDDDGADYFINCPYGQPGDRLWVREKFSRHTIPGGEPYYYPADRVRECVDHDHGFHYWADGNPEYGDWERPKPSIHMPRALSRITLEVTSVLVERLQDISEEDARAEGVEPNCSMIDHSNCDHGGEYLRYPPENWDFPAFSAAESFQSLWKSINGPGSWEANPWVWVIEFKRL